MKRRMMLMALCLVLAACVVPVPRPVMKIAMVAPFEGRLRQVGYDAFPAMRLAIRNAIQSGGAGRYQVTFIAYNDNGDPAMAERVARGVAIDPGVVAVIGHWVPTTTLAATRVYTLAGLALLAPSVPADALPQDPHVFRMGPTQQSAKRDVQSATCDPLSQFDTCASDAPPLAQMPGAQDALAGFSDITLGTAPTPRSVVAFDATNVVLEAIRLDAADGTVTRAGVAEALRRVTYRGLLGEISFDQAGRWADAPLWDYSR